jgi:hypothetical protein
MVSAGWLAAVAGLGGIVQAQTPGGGKPDFSQPTEKGTPGKAPSGRPEENKPTFEPGKRGDKVDLRPKFEKGSVTRYKMRTSAVSKAGIPGLPLPVKPGAPADPKAPAKEDDAGKQETEFEFTFALRTTEVDPEKGSTVEMTYERVRVAISTGDGTMESDSGVPARKGAEIDDVLRPAVESMVGAKMMLKVPGAGNRVPGSGGVGFGLGGLPGMVPDAKSLGGLFGPISTRKKAGNLVSVGEKWTTDDETTTGVTGGIRMRTEYTLRGVKDGVGEVFFTGRLAPGSEGGGGGGTPFQVKDGAYRGKYLWDSKRGQLEAMESEIDFGAAGNSEKTPSGTFKATTRVERLAPASPAPPQPKR